jgi:uncharacterized SAM-binding protein YcdF (DUF218 family)
MIGVSRATHFGRRSTEKTMKSPLITLFSWAVCLLAIGVALLVAPRTAEAAGALVVPEPAVLLLLGVGLSAIAVRIRSRRRT